MVAAKESEARSARTFVGTQCAACDEPLEHTLRGERILQLSCGHVAHEACFYEFIKEFEAQTCPACNAPLGIDTSRGGSIDFAYLNRLVRAAQTPDLTDRLRDQNTPTPWDTDTIRKAVDYSPSRLRHERDHLLTAEPRLNGHRSARNGFSHERQDSVDTGIVSAAEYDGRKASVDSGVVSAIDYAETNYTSNTSRQHGLDLHLRGYSLNGSRSALQNTIPSPTVTVRSEFPTLNKSRQQQSLTCLVTVEVGERSWQHNVEESRTLPSVPSTIAEEAPESPRNPTEKQSAQKLPKPVDSVHEDIHALEEAKEDLYNRCENWHGLDFQRFGKLVLSGTVRVGKDMQAWQDLDCYLFTEMLICVKAKKMSPNASQQWDEHPQKPRVTLKGSILIKKHLKQVEVVPDQDILTLSLTVTELPHFYLQFHERSTLDTWRRALLNIHDFDRPEPSTADLDETTEEDEHVVGSSTAGRRASSMQSSHGADRSHATVPTEYTSPRLDTNHIRLNGNSIHVPLDVVVVVPLAASMQALKVNILRDSLRFLISSLGEKDRMGLVTFGSGASSVPLVGMTSRTWRGWEQVLDKIRPVAQKNMRADVVDGANVAMDLLMQRKSSNPLASIILISDSSVSDMESVDFVASRAEAAKIAINSFGLGLTHKPDAMVELSSKTKASYTYVKDWMMLRECLAGCLGSLQCLSHQNAKLKLRLPEGSTARFVKISGALQVTNRASGRDAEASLGDLRFGDKRDVLVQLVIPGDTSSTDTLPSDPWQKMISGLEALGGPLEHDEMRPVSIEEMPLLQADLSWGNVLQDGRLTQLPRPSLLAITMLPSPLRKQPQHSTTPPIPPHPSIVQRRMELLTSDMLSRAVTLVSRGQPERAQHLLAETRSILKGLGKGGLPLLPPQTPAPTTALPPNPKPHDHHQKPPQEPTLSEPGRRKPSPHQPPESSPPFTPATGIDAATVAALDTELEASLEWMSHPPVFSRDSRKAVLQAIGVISSQRAYSFRTQVEMLWAGRVAGTRRLLDASREWREVGERVVEE